MSKPFLLLAAMFVTLNGRAEAGLIIALTSANGGADTQVQISGSGTIVDAGGGVGAILNFNNFASGSVFAADITPTDVLGIEFSGLVSGNIADPYSATFETIRFENGGTNGDDISLRDQSGTAFSFSVGDTYSVDSTFTLAGTAFSSFETGTFSSVAFDSDNFGGVSLSVSAIPEPSSFLFGGGLAMLLITRRSRKRSLA